MLKRFASNLKQPHTFILAVRDDADIVLAGRKCVRNYPTNQIIILNIISGPGSKTTLLKSERDETGEVCLLKRKYSLKSRRFCDTRHVGRHWFHRMKTHGMSFVC
ncbi:hypothetical protein DPEC_G00317170 [Dallia pectoralis]|uniref:Uncharacterized protein n=1 Tax=Dallia pectoralis TaxID=75939 RepID=A0ACC2FCR6_DALPE|nr:hypothetical protein DPEC_G00317170 [Dallia pectoralis]